MKQTTLLSALAVGAAAQYGAPQVTYTVQPVQWQGAVTVTVTRTFTDYCGCGIPGVSTINGPINTSSTFSTSTTSTSTTSGTNTVNPGSTSTSSTSTTSTPTSGMVAPPTFTTSLGSTSTSTSTTTGGNTVNPGSTSSSSSTTTTTSTSSGSVPPATVTTSVGSTSTSTSSVSSSTVSTTTTSAGGAVVTDEAYIDTVLRHHNVHRSNHSANALTWSPTLADIARTISESCVYQHDQSVRANEVGYYGQNIGAGYPSDTMGSFITLGLYNSEVNNYVTYGQPPDNNFNSWGHFSQIVWKATTMVGCYTNDCSATGLQNTGSGIPPFFTVCNYQPGGNSGDYEDQVGRPLGRPTVFANYKCPSDLNCVGDTF